MGRINSWVTTAFKLADQRRASPVGIPAIVEVEPGKGQAVASSLISLGYQPTSILSDFIIVDLATPADFDKVAKVQYVRTVSAEKFLTPLAYGIDDIYRRITVANHPLLSAVGPSGLPILGVNLQPISSLPTPLQYAAQSIDLSGKFLTNSQKALLENLRSPPSAAPPIPVLTREDWRLVTETKQLMEAPDNNNVSFLCGDIDTGVRPGFGTGVPGIDYNIISISIPPEPPVDTMGHGTWTQSCAFGRVAATRYGIFKPLSQAKVLHIKIFSALGPASTSQVLKAMQICAEQGCRVVNMSIGGPLEGTVNEDPECVMAGKLWNQYGTNFVVAAGNDGKAWSINSPGASPHALTVAAIDWKTMNTSSYSSRGPQGATYQNSPDFYSFDLNQFGVNFLKPDVAGIGGDTHSQVVAGASPWYDGLYDFTPDGWEMMIGTSMATPHVAGLVALAIEQGLINSIQDIKNVIFSGGQKSVDKGYGLLTWSNLKRLKAAIPVGS